MSIAFLEKSAVSAAVLAIAVLFAATAAAAPKKAKSPRGGAPADAAFLGDEVCAGCHTDQAAQFPLGVHGRLKDFELRGAGGRCESCHGPASKHVESGGDKSLIDGFADGASERACAACHQDGKAMSWKGSEHSMAGVGCANCHKVHQSRRGAAPPIARMLGGANPARARTGIAPPPSASLKKAEPELCFDCHRDKRGAMNLPSHHPVREGRMVCSSCHDTHGSQTSHLLRNAESEKAFCTNCHPAKQGPFVFEHAAVEEGCTVCHQPHGTVADNLLKQNEPFLCLQCHEAHFHVGREGATSPVTLPTGGSTNPNGLSGWRKAFSTKCTQCHSQVHGSDLPSQGVSSRGKALTR